MIKEGKIKEAQAAAKVDLDGYSDVNSYSGYLTVGLDGCGSNLFFWFFPAMVGKKYFLRHVYSLKIIVLNKIQIAPFFYLQVQSRH